MSIQEDRHYEQIKQIRQYQCDLFRVSEELKQFKDSNLAAQVKLVEKNEQIYRLKQDLATLSNIKKKSYLPILEKEMKAMEVKLRENHERILMLEADGDAKQDTIHCLQENLNRWKWGGDEDTPHLTTEEKQLISTVEIKNLLQSIEIEFINYMRYKGLRN
jgi:competence protein ComGC